MVVSRDLPQGITTALCKPTYMEAIWLDADGKLMPMEVPLPPAHDMLCPSQGNLSSDLKPMGTKGILSLAPHRKQVMSGFSKNFSPSDTQRFGVCSPAQHRKIGFSHAREAANVLARAAPSGAPGISAR